METIIKIENLQREFKTDSEIVRALKGISFEIQKGDFVSIMGASGSGKTTLLNILGCLDRPTAGDYYLDGISVKGFSRDELSTIRNLKIGFIFQSYNLIPVLTAIENVEFVMLLQGIDPETRKKKALAILKEVGLEEYINRRPLDLSGGQQQRVAVARAIVSEPAIVIADEPTANLDSVTASDLLKTMKRLNQEKGITFIFSTHDRLVMEQAQRLILLKDGVVEKDNNY